MAIRIPRYNLAPMEATLHIDPINFSEPVTGNRYSITLFTSVYSETTNTVSVFTRDEGNRRRLSTRYGGIQRRTATCSRFHENGSRPLCHLASAAAEIAFFTIIFPPRSLMAIGNFVRANTNSNRNTFMRITIVDSRLHMLPPVNDQETYPSPVRFALFSGRSDEHISPGILFIQVSVDSEEFDITEETTWGPMVVPNDLVANIQVLYPGDHYPVHMVGLMAYIYGSQRGTIEGHQDPFLHGLMHIDVDRIIEVIMVGIDILDRPVLRQIYRIVGMKLDEVGMESLLESSQRLGFIVNNGG